MIDLYYKYMARRANIINDDMQFAYCEYRKLFRDDVDIMKLGKHALNFLPHGQFSADVIYKKIKEAIDANSPFSLTRVGNGEGNAVSMLNKNLHPATIKAFFTQFCSQNGLSVPLDIAIAFCIDVHKSLISADVKGFRLFRGNERAVIENSIRNNDLYASLGLIYARWFCYQELRTGSCAKSTVTSAWIHLDLIRLLPTLLESAASVIVITGRSELEGKFRQRLGARLAEFVSVPVQGFMPANVEESHFGRRYHEVRNLLRHRKLSGTLVLVGAGLFGKVYCQDVKESGGVAVDLGSAFDLLAGVKTRPIHSQIDLNSVRW